MENKTLYRLAVQMYIANVEETQDITPTVDEAKAAIDSRLKKMEATQKDVKTFIIFSDESQTGKVEVEKRHDYINVAYLLEDTKTGIIYNENKIELSRDEFKRIAQYITDTF